MRRALVGFDPIPQRRRVDVEQLADVPAGGQLGLAVITQLVGAEADRAGAGLLVELAGSGNGSSLLVRSGASPRPRAVHLKAAVSYAPSQGGAAEQVIRFAHRVVPRDVLGSAALIVEQRPVREPDAPVLDMQPTDGEA
ncbi:MAG TPA: hypothetical protein VF065_16285 [Ilumatobacter sp.]